ncbi:MAG: TolC family protein [Runella sp.]
MKYFFLLFLVIFLDSLQVFSQQMLTLDEAISQALERNYQVKIARSREEIAKNDNTRGNAGMLPIINAQAQQNFTNNSINQKFFNDIRPPLVQSGVNNRNNSAGLSLVWTVFDGFGMFAAAERLREIERLGKTNVQVAIQNTVAEVCAAYYEIIRQQQRLKALKNALEISSTRQDLAQANYEVGTTSKSEYLAAQVDFNQDQAAVLAQEQVIENAKVNLNALMLRDLNEHFSVADSIIFRKDLNLSQLQEKMKRANPDLLAASQNIALTKINEKEVRSVRMPRGDILGGYNYNTFNNEAGFGAQKGSSSVFSYGARISVPIYDGLNQRRREQNAKIAITIAEHQENDLKVQLMSQLQRTYNNYLNSIQLFETEEKNLKIARQNVELAFERYKYGNSTPIEFREAQRNAVATESRLIEAAFGVKINEIELLRLSSSIVEEAR